MSTSRISHLVASRGLVAASLPALLLSLAMVAPTRAMAQEAWRGLQVPQYQGATDASVRHDEDEYEIRFKTSAEPRAVFDFYRSWLEKQGFRTENTKTKRNGFKADMVRGQGGPDDRVELDTKLKNGQYKVEIEFDD